MTNAKKRLRGQGLLEYIALTALVAIVCIGTVKTLGNKVKEHTDRVTRRFSTAMRVGPAAGRGASQDREEGDVDERNPSLPRLPSFPWPR